MLCCSTLSTAISAGDSSPSASAENAAAEASLPPPPAQWPEPIQSAAPNHATDPVLENFSGARTPASGALPPEAASLPQAASQALQQQQDGAMAPLHAASTADGVVVTPEMVAAVMAHLTATGGNMASAAAAAGYPAAASAAPPPSQLQQDWQPAVIASAPQQPSSGTSIANGVPTSQQQLLQHQVTSRTIPRVLV